jgi:hypothetical protein
MRITARARRCLLCGSLVGERAALLYVGRGLLRRDGTWTTGIVRQCSCGAVLIWWDVKIDG